MKHLQDLKTPVNKFANTIKLFGLFFLAISAVGLVSYRSETDSFWDYNNLFLAAVLVAGLVMTAIGELLWKIVLKHSDTTVRRIYYYGEE